MSKDDTRQNDAGLRTVVEKKIVDLKRDLKIDRISIAEIEKEIDDLTTADIDRIQKEGQRHTQLRELRQLVLLRDALFEKNTLIGDIVADETKAHDAIGSLSALATQKGAKSKDVQAQVTILRTALHHYGQHMVALYGGNPQEYNMRKPGDGPALEKALPVLEKKYPVIKADVREIWNALRLGSLDPFNKPPSAAPDRPRPHAK